MKKSRLIIAIVLSAMILISIYILVSGNLYSNHNKGVFNPGLEFVATTAVVLLFFGSYPIYLLISNMRNFDDIYDESKTSVYKNDNVHKICCLLKKTDKNIFVLAEFKDNNEIRPAVYTRVGNKVKSIDVNAQITDFMPINAGSSEVRAVRISDKSTKTQMIFFSSKDDKIDIIMGSIYAEKINCNNAIKNFSVYGITENFGSEANVVIINGNSYALNKTPNYHHFIDKKAVKC